MKFDNIDSFVSKCCEIAQCTDEDIYIIGAGQFGKNIADILNFHNIKWECYVDKIKTGVYEGRNILRYEECRNRKGFYIISSLRYRDDILKDVRHLIGISGDEYIACFDDSIREVWKPEVIGSEALEYVLKNFDFRTVLDVGCGEGIHSSIFLQHGKEVTALDYGQSFYFQKNRKDNRMELIVADINKFESSKSYDLVWCSHVLEHQLNPHSFLCKLHALVKEDGILAITVPPLNTQDFVQGGHISLWTAGILLYHLVLAGFDCSNAHIKQYGENISIVVEKHSVSVMDKLDYDRGDIRKIKQYLPLELVYIDAGDDDHFYGDIKCLNW